MTADTSDIPRGPGGKVATQLARARFLPEDALAQAARRPDLIAAEVIAAVERAAAGTALDEGEVNLVFWGIHALGAARDARLGGPLLRLLARPGEELDPLLGDTPSDTLPRIVAGTFDGDAARLLELTAAPETDEFVRLALFGACAFLAFDGRVDRAAFAAFLERFDDDRPIRGGEAGWHGWALAIALLGLDGLRDRIAAAFDDARLLDGDMAAFEDLLAAARAVPADPERFRAERLGYIEDVVAELDDMLAAAEDDAEAEPDAPTRNPLRDVGRNDPCPCGSGRKFKKCCLSAA